MARPAHGAALVLVAVFVAVLTACGSESPHATPPGGARITVRQRQLTCCATEGQVSYVRLSRAGGDVRARAFQGDGIGTDVTALDEAVSPGTFRVESWQRTCDGNCGHLDPPTDRCAMTVDVAPAEHRTLTVLVSPGSGCTIG
jgi:hypothetical protein